jgi:hypothetical protein
MATFAQAVLTHDSPYEVVAFTVDDALIADTTTSACRGAFEEVERHYPPEDFGAHIAVGFRRVNGVRAEKYVQAKEKGYELLTYVSSQAFKWPDLVIGDNCWILEYTILHPFVTIGNDVYLGSACHIGHNSTIGDHTFMAGLAGPPEGSRWARTLFRHSLHRSERAEDRERLRDRCGRDGTSQHPRTWRVCRPPAAVLPTPSDALPGISARGKRSQRSTEESVRTGRCTPLSERAVAISATPPIEAMHPWLSR